MLVVGREGLDGAVLLEELAIGEVVGDRVCDPVGPAGHEVAGRRRECAREAFDGLGGGPGLVALVAPDRFVLEAGGGVVGVFKSDQPWNVVAPGPSFTAVTLFPTREMIDLDDLVLTPGGVARAGLSIGAARLHVVAVSVTRARHLIVRVQVWELVDPKAEWDYGVSPYSSMRGNPINYNDPSGDSPNIAVFAVAGG